MIYLTIIHVTSYTRYTTGYKLNANFFLKKDKIYGESKTGNSTNNKHQNNKLLEKLYKKY